MPYFKKENSFKKDRRGKSDERRGSFDERRSSFDSGRGRPFERDSFNDRRGSGRRLEMHDAICARCGRPCQLPFKPTGTKPVYCRDCFGKTDYEEKSSQGELSTEQFITLNRKLDKILKFLKID